MKNKDDICKKFIELEKERIKVNTSLYDMKNNPNLKSSCDNEKDYLNYINGQLSILAWMLD